ncbi:hypothetical protein Acidovoranil_31790 [Acidovorax sp. FG27]
MMRRRLAGVALIYSPSLFKLIFGADIESPSKLTYELSGEAKAQLLRSPLARRVRSHGSPLEAKVVMQEGKEYICVCQRTNPMPSTAEFLLRLAKNSCGKALLLWDQLNKSVAPQELQLIYGMGKT